MIHSTFRVGEDLEHECLGIGTVTEIIPAYRTPGGVISHEYTDDRIRIKFNDGRSGTWSALDESRFFRRVW